MEHRTERGTTWRRIWSVAALLMIVFAGPAGSDSSLRDGAKGSEACRAAEREAILSLVREHRRSASDPWLAAVTEAIHAEAVEADVDPLLVASIVARESSFRTDVVSHKGAVGLMQLRPFVARDLSSKSGVTWSGTESLRRPELNVRLGILYYKELVDRFDGDAATALTAYNVGPTRVSRQLRSGTYRGSRYADEILDLYHRLSRQVRGQDTKPEELKERRKA